MPDGTKLGEAKLRGVESSGMILAEDEVGHRRGPRRDHGARRRRCPWARRSPSTCRSPTRCSSSRSRPNRPDAMARLRRGARPARGHRARRWPRTRRRDDAEPRGRRPRRGPRVASRSRPRDLPALHRARVRGREDRPVAAVAEAAPDGGRAAPDLERRGHHELRDALPPASRCTRSTSTRCAGGGSSCGARGEGETMTTLDGVERTLRLRAWRSSATPRARAGSPASWAGRSRRSPTRPRAC